MISLPLRRRASSRPSPLRPLLHLQRSLLLVLTALTLVVPTLLIPSAARAAEGDAGTAQATTVTDGTVVWGVRASFRNYIGPDGITISDGLTRNGDGEFVFDVSGGSFDSDTKRLQLDLVGTVRFYAHAGALDMTFRNLEVVIDGEQPAIYADVVSKALTGETVDFGHVPVVDIPFAGTSPQVAGGRTVWNDLPTTLAEATAPAFAGFYQSGSSMDTVDIDYAGPGGAPVMTAEQVVASGAPRYEPAGQITGVSSVANVVADAQRGVLHVQHVPTGTSAAVLQAYDYATLAPLPHPPVASADQGYPGLVLDPGSGAVLMAQGTGLVAYRYDATGGYTSVDVDTGVGAVQEITYDSPRDRMVVLGATGLAVLTRNPAGPAGYTVTVYTGLSFEGRESVAVVSANAVITSVASTSKGARRIGLITSSRTLSETPIPGVTDDKALQPDVYDQPTMVFRDNTGIWLSAYTGSKIRVAAIDGAYQASGPWLRAGLGTFLADRKEHLTNSVLMLDYAGRKARVWKEDGWADITVPNLGSGSYFNNLGGDIGTDQSVFVASTTNDDRVLKFALTGVAPIATTSPASTAVGLGEGETAKDITLDVAFTGADSVRWQTRVSSTGRWADVPGATGTSLTWRTTTDDGGRQFRALGTSEIATATSAVATLDVRFFPRVAAQPDDVTTHPGDDAQFKVMPSGNPYPTIAWQRRVGGFWQAIDADDENFHVDGGFLTVRDTNTDQSGAKIRARLSNDLGTTYTRVATLTVAEPSTVAREVTAGTLTWGVKQSFRDYLAGPIAHGSVSVADGAAQKADGTFTFPVTGGWNDPAAGTSEIRFGGTVRFTGHDGPPTCAPEHSPCLSLTITDPVLRVDGDDAVLVADVTSKDETTHQLVSYPGVELAEVDASGGLLVAGDRLVGGPLPATLSASGAAAFAGFYAEGATLDPVTLDGTLGEEVTEPVDVATSTTVTLAPASLTYGRTPRATVRVVGDGAPVTGPVTVTVAGRTVRGTLAGGTATVALPSGLRPGSHQVAASYDGTEGVLASSGAATLTVTKATPSITWKLKKKIRKAKRPRITVVATLPGAAGHVVTGQIVVTENGRVLATARLTAKARGRVVIRLPRLAKGRHHLRLELGGSAVQEPVATSYRRLIVR